MKHRAWMWTLLVSAAGGAIVWALSPIINGHMEPWDSSGHYYPVALCIAGLFSGLSTPRVKWAFYWGPILGQLAYTLAFLPKGPLLIVGVLTMCIYAVLFLLAALLTSFLRSRAASWRQNT